MTERRTKIALERAGGEQEMVFLVRSRRWMKDRLTELRVDASGLVATGDLGAYKAGTLQLAWNRIAELHYGPAGRGAIEGLYAREGEWCSRCILPRVSEAEADGVIAAIAARYPRMAKSATSALETAVGEARTLERLSRRQWLPQLGRRRVPIAVPLGRI